MAGDPSNAGVRVISGQSEADDPFDSDRVDKEAAAIAAERIRNGAANEAEDGTEALERLGISVSVDADE